MEKYMQWIAVLAAIGWSFLQVFMLFIATQCVFALVELRSKTENIYQKLLSRSIILLFYSLFILPLISLGVFYYQVINITSWSELLPAVWVFAMWCGSFVLFLILLDVKSYFEDKKRK